MPDSDATAPNSLLWNSVIYRCVVGSRAYGLDGPDSDTDRRGFFLPPADLHWSLNGVPEQLENLHTEETYWEIQKFLRLALKANPSVLECLYTPLVEHATPIAEELRAVRSSFLSRIVHQTYAGYVTSQFNKLQSDLRKNGSPKWKQVMHMIRLLISGITALEEGYLPVAVVEHRERLLAIKRGEVPWEEIDAWRLALHARFDASAQSTQLPELPDYRIANDLLLKARRSAL